MKHRHTEVKVLLPVVLGWGPPELLLPHLASLSWQ
jgi:hypothetical protein